MRALTRQLKRDVAVFRPEEMAERTAQADGIISYAKQVKDWPLLEDAVDAKLNDQAEFVQWWQEHVSPLKGGDRKSGHQSPRPATLISADQATTETSIKKQQVEKWKRRLREPEKYRAMLYGAAYAKAMAETQNTTAAQWTGDPESYTPAQYIEAARSVLGGIDLDPASNAFAQEVVQADTWYDAEKDGLKQEWRGRVFLNPPYKYPLVGEFIAKLLDEVLAGNVSAAILLTNNNTDTRWFHQAARVATAVCFTAGRINFYKADGQITQPTNGQTFFYFGDDQEAFTQIFGGFGLIMQTVEVAQ